MKKNIILSILAAAIISLGAASCTKWLSENPTSFIGPDSIEDSEAGVDVWVAGVYSNWLDDMFRWSGFPFVLELDCDYISGPDWLMGYLGAGNFQSEEGVMNLWKKPYNLIVDANLAQRKVAEMKNVSDDYKDNALGELYFQEAFAYFLMVRAFGPVPVIEKDVMDGGAYNNGRNSVSEVYAHITKLLEDAAGMMYSASDSRHKAGHVSAASAAGLLAKVYATMASAAMPANTPMTVRTGNGINARYETEEDGSKVYKYNPLYTNIFLKTDVAGYEDFDSDELYGKAALWAKKVIDGEYGTVELSAYDDLWKASNRDASEFLFNVQSLDGETVYCTQIHTYYAGYSASASSTTIQSGGWIGCTYNWYRLFDEDDYRITKGVRHLWQYYYQTDYDGYFYYPESLKSYYSTVSDGNFYQYSADYQCLAFTTKYSDVMDNSAKYTDSAWPFLRYADVLLIYAEAENELGYQDEAVKFLNIVRKRSNATEMTTVAGKDALRSAIFEERAKEFACEGDRRWDLIRWGIYVDAMNAVMYDDSGINKERSAKHLLFPIPQEEINSNSEINTNNPGWN